MIEMRDLTIHLIGWFKDNLQLKLVRFLRNRDNHVLHFG